MQDATLQSMDYLDDPDRYTVIRNVPIFRAHRRLTKDDKGNERAIVVTESDLSEIANRMAALEQYDGVALRITDGHITPRPDVPESAQPELLGFARHARCGNFGPAHTPAVLVDFYIRKDRMEKFRQRPYRSAEYYPPTKEIRGVGLLLRDPGLDLGIVTYDRADAPYLYAIENTMPDTPPVIDPETNAAAEDFSAEEVQQYERMCRYLSKKGLIKYAAGPSAPSGGNTFVPSTIPDKRPVLHAGEEEPELYAKLEAAEKRIAGLIEERERERCVQMVQQLKAERYMLDEGIEVGNLLRRSGPERERHVAYIRRTHAQLPGGETIEVYSGPVEGGTSRPTTEEDMRKAVSLASKLGISYDEALGKLK